MSQGRMAHNLHDVDLKRPHPALGEDYHTAWTLKSGQLNPELPRLSCSQHP